MDYEKKYPITQLPGKHVLATWTRGYRDVAIYYEDRLVAQARGAGSLKKGVRLHDNDLGSIDLKLSEKPVMLDVIIDGYHSPSNVGHPVRDLKGYSMFFWILTTLSFIAGMFEIGLVSEVPEVAPTVILVNVLIIGAYVVSAVLVGKGKPSGYYLAVSVFGFFTLLSLLVIALGLAWGWLLYFFMALRIGALVMMLINLKTPNSARKHLKYKLPENDSLLDSKF